MRRALAAAAVAGVAAAFGLVELHAEARYIFDRLVDQGLPLVVLSALCGLGAAGRARCGGGRRARCGPLAAGAVVAVIWGWGVAQFPYLLPTSLKIGAAAAPDPTLDVGLRRLRGRRGAGAARAGPALHAQPARPARARAAEVDTEPRD